MLLGEDASPYRYAMQVGRSLRLIRKPTTYHLPPETMNVPAENFNAADARLVQTGFRRLTPAAARIFQGAFSLHCQVEGDAALYRGVWAVLMFPVTHPDAYISLRYTDTADKEQEIGVIERLADFPAEAQALVRGVLARQYHQQTIVRIFDVTCRYGLLFFSVETGDGPEEFMMPWRHDRAEDFGSHGKVLLDSLDNRYILPDVRELPAADRRKFLGFIYW